MYYYKIVIFSLTYTSNFIFKYLVSHLDYYWKCVLKINPMDNKKCKECRGL